MINHLKVSGLLNREQIETPNNNLKDEPINSKVIKKQNEKLDTYPVDEIYDPTSIGNV